MPTCFSPTNVQVTNTTGNTADFSWDAETTATNGYIWVVMADGDDPNTGTPIASGTTPAGTTSANVTGLSASTDYDFYVKSDCGGGDESDWASGLDFQTPCATFPAPYVENFDSTSIPNCWSQDSAGDWDFQEGFTWNTTGCSATPDDHTGNSGSFAAVDMTDTSAGTAAILEMPLVDVSTLTTPSLSFYMFMCTQGYSPANELYIDVYDGTTWNQVGVINSGSAAWEEHIFDLTSHVSNNTVKLRFRSLEGPTGNTFYGDIAIDDVRIDELPTCFDPINIQLNSYTATTADFSWDAEPTATNGYNWVVMADGDDPNVDTPVASGSVPAGTLTANVTGLSADTDYDFYVKSDCGAGDLSRWSLV
ncbi:fibronectin type III domain-containing protein [Mesonia maritima]